MEKLLDGYLFGAAKSGLDINNYLASYIFEILFGTFRILNSIIIAAWSIGSALLTLVVQLLLDISTLIPLTITALCSVAHSFSTSVVAVYTFVEKCFHYFAFGLFNGIRIASDVADQLQNLPVVTHKWLRCVVDSLQFGVESTAIALKDASSMFDFLRLSLLSAFTLLIHGILSLIVFFIFLPFRVAWSVPAPIYAVGIGLPLVYYFVRVLWTSLVTQERFASSRFIRFANTSRLLAGLYVFEPVKIGLFLFVDLFLRILNPFKLWAIFASLLMVENVYLPFLRDISLAAQWSFSLYKKILHFGLRFFVHFIHQSVRLGRRGLRMIITHFFCAVMQGLTQTGLLFHSLLAFIGNMFFLPIARERPVAAAGGAAAAAADSGGALPSVGRNFDPNVKSSTTDSLLLKNLRQQLNEEIERHLCVVCQDEQKTVVILPCRHVCLCQQCSMEIFNNPDFRQRICPLCRRAIAEVIQVYV